YLTADAGFAVRFVTHLTRLFIKLNLSYNSKACFLLYYAAGTKTINSNQNQMQHLKKQLHIVPLILFLFTTFMYAPHLSAQKKSNKKTSKNKTEQSINLTSNG